MESTDASSIRQGIRFLLVTFIITYSAWFFLALVPRIEYGTPSFMVLYLTGGCGPTISTIPFVVINKDERKDYLARLFKWKPDPLLYVLAAGVVGAMCVLIVALHRSVTYTILDWYMLLPLYLVMVIGGGLEELGRRGVMQELFNKNKFNLLFSSLIIGVVWAFWHWCPDHAGLPAVRELVS